MAPKARRQSKVAKAAPASGDDSSSSTTPSTPPPAKAEATPLKAPSQAQQQGSATPAKHRSTSKPRGASKESEEAAPPPPARPWWHFAALAAVVLAVLLAVGTAMCLYPGETGSPPARHPCECAVPVAESNRLAKVMLSRRSGVSGVHWRTGHGDLDFVKRCTGGAVVRLPTSFASVDDLRGALVAPFQERHGGRCVVWVTTPEAISTVANALKELMENNALAGRPVVPEQRRATLVLETTQTREQLKAKLPHRVVHMLTEA